MLKCFPNTKYSPTYNYTMKRSSSLARIVVMTEMQEEQNNLKCLRYRAIKKNRKNSLTQQNDHTSVHFLAIWLKFYIKVDEICMKLLYYISHPSNVNLKFGFPFSPNHNYGKCSPKIKSFDSFEIRIVLAF